MTVLLDCARWQVLVNGVAVAADDDDIATYDSVLCVYDAQTDTALTGASASQVVWSVIPMFLLGGALRVAAGLEPRGDDYRRHLEHYASKQTE
jgi:hypothetical protein